MGTSRYGVNIRKRENKILAGKNSSHECVKCGKKSVKRTHNAVWQCSSCGSKFAGGAYMPKTG